MKRDPPDRETPTVGRLPGYASRLGIAVVPIKRVLTRLPTWMPGATSNGCCVGPGVAGLGDVALDLQRLG